MHDPVKVPSVLSSIVWERRILVTLNALLAQKGAEGWMGL